MRDDWGRFRSDRVASCSTTINSYHMKVPLGNLKDRHVFCCPFFRTLTLVIATRLLKSLNFKLLQKYSISKTLQKKNNNNNNNIDISANYGRI